MALIIYRVKPDFAFWRLLPTDPDLFKKIGDGFALKEMRPGWPNPSLYVQDPVRYKRGDFANGFAGGITFRSSVLGTPAGAILASSGELLDAKLEETGENLLVLNPMVCYNCFDRANSKFRTTPDGSVVVQISKYAFYPDRIGLNSLFKIPETFRTEIYTVVEEGGEVFDSSQTCDFFSQYHASNLCGLAFDKIWASNEV